MTVAMNKSSVLLEYYHSHQVRRMHLMSRNKRKQHVCEGWRLLAGPGHRSVHVSAGLRGCA
eukprot:scaffold378868_cov18-Prasinocladus_malaysianus.AAC.1